LFHSLAIENQGHCEANAHADDRTQRNKEWQITCYNPDKLSLSFMQLCWQIRRIPLFASCERLGGSTSSNFRATV